jgi:hypothetical protein
VFVVFMYKKYLSFKVAQNFAKICYHIKFRYSVLIFHSAATTSRVRHVGIIDSIKLEGARVGLSLAKCVRTTKFHEDLN